jgi:hypothetical protein
MLRLYERLLPWKTRQVINHFATLETVRASLLHLFNPVLWYKAALRADLGQDYTYQ